MENYCAYIDSNTLTVKSEFSGTTVTEADISLAADTLNEALSLLAKQGGGKLFLGPGTFPLNRPLSIESQVALSGSGESTHLVSDSNHSEEALILVGDAERVTLQDFSLESTAQRPVACGLVIDNSGDLTVTRISARNFSKSGIVVRNNSFLCQLVNCVAAGNEESNILVTRLAKTRVGDYPPTTIQNCMIFGGGVGIALLDATLINVVGCSVYQAGSHSFLIDGYGGCSNSDLISGCRSFQAGGNAVLVRNASEFNASSNIFCWHRGNGIELENTTWAAINGNEIIDTGVRSDPPRTGILMRSGTRGAQVTGNTIFNWPEQQPMDCGIVEDASCYKNLIGNNIINYFLNRAIVSEGKESHEHDNVTENMAYAPAQGEDLKQPPYDGSLVPIHNLWKAMGPLEADAFGFRYPDFDRAKLKLYLGKDSGPSPE